MGISGIFGNINQTKKRSNAKKLSFKIMSALLGCTLFLSPIKVSAQGIQTRSMDNQVNYTLAGETDGVLDYARTDFTKEDSNGIYLTVTKWAKLPGSWGGTDKGPYNGRFLLNFFNDEFYKEIESITINGTAFEKEAEGALWKVPINNQTLQSGLIGVITNRDIVIKLKNGKTLDSLGLASKKIDFTTVWVRADGKADKGGYDNGFILKNNPNVPELPTNTSKGNTNYLGTGLNGLGTDGTQSKDGNFSGGHAGKMVSYDAQTKTIKSTVSFKPDQNFLQANSAWVLYINEVIPQELLQYIDTDNVTLGVSTPTGTITASNPIKLVVDPNGNGVISTKDTPELSIVGGDWNKVTQVRSTLDSQVFYGALGQRRSYTIEYKLKSNVTNQQFAEALNNYINTNGQQLNFESWLTADFVDSSSAFPNIRKPDGGKPNKIIQNTYTNAFLQVLDTDKDGLFDFVEDEIGTDKFNVDTDGDGVPDGQEYLTDHTDPKDAKSYLVVKPNVTTTNIEANTPQTIVGTVPKTIYPNPADTSTNLTATNTDAGNVIVKAYKYVADDTDYTTQPVKAQTTIPYSNLTDGNFTVNVPAGTFNDGDKVILVAYSPDGNNPMVSDTKVNVGAIKVTFDTNGGKWSDGTDTDKVVNAVGGTATQPEEPTRDGYQFLGWASSASATAAEANILTNITDAKEVFAVWKDVKAPEITTISDQTVVEGNPISEITVTTDDPNATVTVSNLPNGVTYDPTTKKISGTPTVTDWTSTEETREFTVTVEAKDEAGNTSTKTFKITVQRDTDRDGTPDVTDTDDDGDGYPDTEEVARGTDPKDPTSKPSTSITPISDQTVVEGNPISEITVTVDNPNTTVTVSNLPNGVTYNPTTKKISGTPTITNWTPTEETREITVTVTATDTAGNPTTQTFKITVQRDTDHDGNPDITDLDDDGDGVADTDEQAAGSNPKDPNSRPAVIITPVPQPTISNPTQTVVDKKPITSVVINPGNPASAVTVDTNKLPNGVTYDPTTKTISGTPNVTDWGTTEESRKFEIPVVVTNPDGSKVTKIVEITVQRDTDGDGDPDVTDPDDDGDGYTDAEEVAKGTDPKDPNSKPTTPPTPQPTITNPTQTVIDEKPITNIVITPGDPASTITVDTTKLPNGVTYDPTTKTISGTPDVTDWGTTEETRKFEIPVVVTNPDGTTVTKTIEITVQRDTDGDGNPDVTDPDDDNDGYTDVEENAKGSDPKNSNSRPAAIITPVEPVSISNQTQTVVDKTPISPILIGTGNIDSTVTVDTTKLPNGVTYDPNAFTISGTPTITDWGTGEETRKFEIPVVVTNPDGSKVTKIVEITVQRDTDGDGTPDVTDTDDDGDGYPDTEEVARGTDPKDPASKPTTSITPIPDQTVVEGNPISEITVTVDNPNTTVTVSNLPNGVTYDPTTKKITGTPAITDWTPTEETREITVTVTATDTAGNPTTSTFKITVQRDTDGDGDPDVTDPDDDNDGYTDVEENAKGTDPKDPNSKPTTPPTPQPTISNPTQTVIDEKPISNIVITPGDPASTVTVDTTKLPNGVTYDPTTKTISGTPDVTDWGTTEESRKFEIPVVVTNPDGTTVTKTVEITVQRDTDGDGNPDVTDPDDDNDGYTDVEENSKGSDPKNSNSRPAAIITPVEPVSISNQTQTVIDKTPISPILIGTGNIDSTVTVDTTKLPNGVTYDPNAFTISGTPTVTDWGTGEETRKFEIHVVVTNPDGSKVTKIVEITVQRDTDGDGTPDVTDTDDDGDGYPDTEEVARGTDPKDPTSKPTTSITPISDQTVVEGNPINEITVTVDNPNTTVTVSNLPNGVTYNPTTKKITGTPAITDWTPTEETREITVTVTATDTAGNPTTSTFKITVQRDTDHDGDPDVTDTDDDGDGYPDTEEVARGTDPKDPNSKPAITPVPTPQPSNPSTSGSSSSVQKTPQTSDATNLFGHAASMTFFGTLLLILAFIRRREHATK